MIESLTIRKATPREAEELSELAIRSKAYWGYSGEFMEACRDELTVTEQLINSDNIDYVIAEHGSKLVGFYAIERYPDKEYELEALFVEPDHIGKGVGKLLVNHAKKEIQASDGKTLIIQGDPNAEHFYLAVGGEKIGSRESASIPGRNLPLFKIELSETEVT